MKAYIRNLLFILGLLAFSTASFAAEEAAEDTYDQDSVLQAAEEFFGEASSGLANIIEKVFKEQGRPNGFIKGEEASGAIGVGLRYGNGTLTLKNGGSRKVYWQGPSIGWDLGANASKAFTLVYHMKSTDQIFQRFPGVEGTLYYVGGFGVNYQQSGDVILAPIRAGVGLRAGANVGYLHYTRKKSWVPF